MNSVRKWLRSLSERWKAETPRMHKRIIYVSSCVFYVATYIMSAVHANTSYMPEWIDKIFLGVLVVTSAISGYSHFQKENDNDSHDDSPGQQNRREDYNQQNPQNPPQERGGQYGRRK